MNKEIKFEEYRNIESHTQLGQLAMAIHECVKSGFGREDFSLEDTQEHLKGDIILVGKDGEKVVCFSNTLRTSPRQLFSDPSFPDVQGYYFAAAAVANEAQGEGLYSEMNKKRVAQAIGNGYNFTPLIFTRTQNPLVETAIRKELEQYPKNGRFRGFTLERRLMKGAYGQMLTAAQPPASHEAHIQEAYDDIDAQAGDAFVLFFHLHYDMSVNPDGAGYYP